MEEIVSMMVGRELTQRFPERTNVPKEITLEVEHLTAVSYTHLRKPSGSPIHKLHGHAIRIGELNKLIRLSIWCIERRFF